MNFKQLIVQLKNWFFVGEERKPVDIIEPDFEVEAPLPSSNIIIVNVMAHSNDGFNGRALLRVLTDEKLKHGAMQIFHKFTGENKLFSLASVTEPGSFDLAKMATKNYVGVSLFFDITAVVEPLASLDAILTLACSISVKLDAEVTDSKHQPLTTDIIHSYHKNIVALSYATTD